MKSPNLKYQSGVALIIFVLMLMGAGGYLLVGFTQGILKQAEFNKTEHNTRVLIEAKQALLQFAYNYPATNGNGPGRLPCADIDNDGDANDNDDGDDDVTTDNGECIALGHFPWNEPNLYLYDIRDADGQRLWYAVSENFATNVAGGNTINSDASGTITVRDQSGNVIYNGLNPTGLFRYGVAAIIIAPGDTTARNGVTQDRSVANADDPFDTTADTDPGIILASNYLDRVVGTEDNADFAQDSATDGFIFGPVNIQSTNAVNDQMIVITAAEVIEVAEKATLQAYRNSMLNYLAPVVDGGTGGVYPWLYNYEVADVTGLSEDYRALNDFTTPVTGEKDMYLGNFGRIPSIFELYFAEAPSREIESKIALSINNALYSGTINYNQTTPCCTTGTFTFVNTHWNGWPAPFHDHNLTFETAEPVTGLRFEDTVDVMGADATLIGTIAATESYTPTNTDWYFWEATGSRATGNWRMCNSHGYHLSDCHVDDDWEPDPHGDDDDNRIEILKVHIAVTFPSGPDAVEFKFDRTNLVGPPVNPVITAADNNGHAQITANFAVAEINTPTVVISYEYDSDYEEPGDWNVEKSGTLEFSSFPGASMDLGLRYYPELPDWVFDNGWHDSIMMAYAQDYRPDTPVVPCTEGTDCIQINNFAGNNDNKISILTIAGQHDWVDDGAPGFSDDVGDVFDAENADILDIDGTEYLFDSRELGGNDKILVIEEL